MNISEAAERAGLPTKTIRYYEGIGLVEPAHRRDNGYRDYADRDVHMLRFLSRARGLGFSVADCRALVALYGDTERKSADVKAIALNRVTLVELSENCHGDNRPDCPIIDDLAERLAG
jgi:MerR family copper efflux transcriptional regulator